MIVKVVVLLLALCLALAKAKLVGDPTNFNMKDPQVQEALNFAVAQYNKDSGSLYTSQVLNVIKVQTQPRVCTLAVWSQPWLDSMKLVENTC
ncbi:cystatin C precursor [Silurus asotus]|uniref:Cystatin C n=1 Tax=Silurus asotus TaxID=30991 RepID=A0AAD5FCG0_SILAS|nr:cystatin C precursor [Silurus asotus]